MTSGARARSTIVAVALALTACQVAEAMLVARGPSWSERYFQLLEWDSGWYQAIVESGYRSTLPPVRDRPDVANVSFFPGYPVAAGLVARVTGWSSATALLATAQLAAWLAWTYVLLLCRRWGLSAWRTAIVVGAIAVHPAAFFLVVGYAESLLIAMLLGFVFWSARPSGAAAVLAALHGFVMTATRIFGIVAAVYPLAHADRSRAAVRRALGVAAVAGLGIASFFAYCHLRFGAWDLYMQSVRAGSDDTWQGGALFDPVWYRVSRHQLVAAFGGDVGQLNLLAVPVTLWELGAVGVVAMLARGGERRAGLGLLLVAGFMFVMGVDGRASLWMSGMLRYVFPMHVCAVLAVAALTPATALWTPLRRVFFGTAALAGLASLSLQLELIGRFVTARWVA